MRYYWYNTIQYNTIQYNTIQYNTIQYNTIHVVFFLNDINVHNIYVYDILSFCKYTWYSTIHTHIPRRKFDDARCAEVLTDQFIACGGRKHANAVLDGNLIHGVATMVLLEELKSWNRHSNFGSIVWFKHSIPMIGGHNDSVKNARVKRGLPSFSCARGDESWRHSEKDRQAVHSSDLAVTLDWLLLAPTVRNYKELQVSQEMQVKVVMSHTDQQLHVAAAWYHFTNFETESAFCVPTTAICIRLKQLLRGGSRRSFWRRD